LTYTISPHIPISVKGRSSQISASYALIFKGLTASDSPFFFSDWFVRIPVKTMIDLKENVQNLPHNCAEGSEKEAA
jgi:hypothetical protein